MRELEITTIDENQRLDKFLLKYLNKSPRAFVYKMLRKKNIKLNNTKATGNEILKNGDNIKLYFSENVFFEFMENKQVNLLAGGIDIVFEDENILVCNKQAGVLSQPDNAFDKDSLIDRILLYLYKNNQFDVSEASVFTPGLCNRLDRNTTGLVICGKNLPSVQCLNHAFKHRLIDKHYKAIVKGLVTEEKTLKSYYEKDHNTNIASTTENKTTNSIEIITSFKPVSSNNGLSLLDVKLITGKSHQIRVHLKSQGTPIIGDGKYGDIALNATLKKALNINRQLLHAERVIFTEIEGYLEYLKGTTITAPLPSDFIKTMSYYDL